MRSTNFRVLEAADIAALPEGMRLALEAFALGAAPEPLRDSAVVIAFSHGNQKPEVSEAVRLVAEEGMSPKEAAQKAGVRPNTLHQRLRGMQRRAAIPPGIYDAAAHSARLSAAKRKPDSDRAVAKPPVKPAKETPPAPRAAPEPAPSVGDLTFARDLIAMTKIPDRKIARMCRLTEAEVTAMRATVVAHS
jgi:transposase-like protein